MSFRAGSCFFGMQITELLGIMHGSQVFANRDDSGFSSMIWLHSSEHLMRFCGRKSDLMYNGGYLAGDSEIVQNLVLDVPRLSFYFQV